MSKEKFNWDFKCRDCSTNQQVLNNRVIFHLTHFLFIFSTYLMFKIFFLLWQVDNCIANCKCNLTFSGVETSLWVNCIFRESRRNYGSYACIKGTLIGIWNWLIAWWIDYIFSRAYVHKVSNSDHFVNLLISSPHDEKLFNENRKRNQGPDDSMAKIKAVILGYLSLI